MGEQDSGTWVKRRDDGDTMHVRSCRIEVLAGPEKGFVRVFSAPSIIIGRGNADVQLTDKRASALHAEIRLEEEGFRLRDLGSRNGTLVGGLRVIDAYMLADTTFVVGDTTIRVERLAGSTELQLSQAKRLVGLVGGSPPMRRVYEMIERLAATEATVLVTGETGVGKELVAEAIHERSTRRGKKLVVLDCGSIPAQLVEDQLFGHEAGAFTGATDARPGVFEAAQGGTVFLDEIGELPLDVQPKLLRVVETRQVRRIGGIAPIACDVRLVAATNRDLAAEVNRDAFRADLYFRIAVARIHIPPLREHREDLDALIDHFVEKLGGTPVSGEFREWAKRHAWPGNVRELRAAIEQHVVLAKHPEMLAMQWASSPPGIEVDVSVPFKENKRKVVDELERRYITELIDAHDGNVSAAARAADLDRMTIYRMLYRAGLRDRSD